MLKFSLGVPKKAPVRLDRVPTVEDIQNLYKKAEIEGGKDLGISWTFQNIEFRLFVRYEVPTVTWRMWNSSVSDNTPPWTSNEKQVKIVHRQILACCNELAGIKVSRPAPVQASAVVIGPAVPAEDMDRFLEAVAIGPTTWQINGLESLATGSFRPIADTTSGAAQQMTIAFAGATLQLMRRFADQYNRALPDAKQKQVSITELGEATEGTERVLRWRAATEAWCISARACTGQLELFFLPLVDVISMTAQQRELTPICKFALHSFSGRLHWTVDALPVGADEVRRLLFVAFSNLISQRVAATGEVPTNSDLEKRNLAQRIVSQQEEVQRRIARDLHDAVIADVTLLKRELLSDKPIGREAATQSLDEIIGRLREICYDLSPSDLKDWGLKTTIEALLEQVASRTKAQCTLNCDVDIPSLDSFVELHVFRIIQESLNNTSKYSGANQIAVTVEFKHGWLSFAVRDNGKGFDPAAEPAGRTKDGGMGRTSMQERVELIRTLFPARLDITSQPGQGTTTTLFIKVRV
jgi:signal transduction histidine kinase